MSTESPWFWEEGEGEKKRKESSTINPLKWVGGKGWLTETISEELKREGISLHSITGYYEPFCGSAAVFFHLRRQGLGSVHAVTATALLSDTNTRLVAFYRKLKTNPVEIIREYARAREAYNSGTSEALREARYYTWREQANAGDEVAFLLVNRACFNGVWRENKKGDNNVPWGKRKTLPDLTDNLMRASRALQGTTISAQDWKEVLSRVHRGLVYIDAPYVGTFVGYGAVLWTDEDDRLLGAAIDVAVGRGATVLWSLPDSEHAHAVLAGLKHEPGVIAVEKPGQISVGKRVPQRELLAIIRKRP